MTTERILRIKDVIAACGLSRSSIYARSNAGTFPAPVRLSERRNNRRLKAVRLIDGLAVTPDERHGF